jgi:O-antigen/teichoic acid export membrane protein
MKELVERTRHLLQTRVAKNLFWISLGSAAGMLFGFLSNVYLARTLLPEAFGKISYAQTWIQYLILIADFGLYIYAVREIAKQRERLAEFARNIVSFRFVVSLVLLALFFPIAWMAFRSYEMKLLVICSSLMVLVSALGVEWAFQGIERMNVVALSRALTGLLPLLLFLFFVKSPEHLVAVPLLRFLGTVLVAIFILRFLGTKIDIFRFDRCRILDYLKASRYFWFLLLFVQIYHGADIIILGSFRTAQEVGLYAAAFRLINLLLAALGLVNAAVFPVLSDYGIRDMRRFFVLKRAYLLSSILLGGVTVAIFLLMGDKLLLLVFGEAYRGSIGISRILIVGVAIVMYNGPYSQSLLAKGFERDVLKVAGVCAISNVVLNLVSIPHFGGLGAAVSYVVSELIGAAWVARIYYQKVRNQVGPQ